MTDGTNGTGSPAPGSTPDKPVQVQVIGQYIKDLSFENPNVNALLNGPGDDPGLKLEVNVGANRVGPDVYESAIVLKAHATNASGVIYDLETVYAGLFKVENIPDAALEPFLLINCPTLLFPFVRRLVADITRESGFPPLLLDPIDFAGLYVRRQQEAAKSAQAAAPKN